MSTLALVSNRYGRLSIRHYFGNPKTLENTMTEGEEFLICRRLKFSREHTNFPQELADGVFYLYRFAVHETLDRLRRTEYPRSFPLRLEIRRWEDVEEFVTG